MISCALFTRLSTSKLKVLLDMRHLLSRWVPSIRIPGCHTLWSTSGSPVSLKDYELVTLIASIFAYKTRVGPIRIYVDEPSYDYLASLRILSLYDGGVYSLNSNTDIDPRIFWSANKIMAVSEMPTPGVVMDMDAIFWKKPWPLPNADVIALHSEPSDWPSYRKTSCHSKVKGIWTGNVSPGLVPYNTAVTMWFNSSLKRAYSDAAIDFMEKYSNGKFEPVPYCVRPDGSAFLEEQIFAEQMMLSVVSSIMGARVRTLGVLDRLSDHMKSNKYVSHLWNSKSGYDKHGAARKAYVNQMIHTILHEFPDSGRILSYAGLASCRVVDSNSGAVRYSHPGEWTLPGETIESL